jgi:NAD(P)-dependent dehydrogenase (short-subunit alcohol dehydrogenase family)
MERCSRSKAQSGGWDATFNRTDISGKQHVRQLIQDALDRHGHIDVLYNNAAV